MEKTIGFYPHINKVYKEELDPDDNYNSYRIVDTRDSSVHRTGILTRRDAVNQLVSLNFRFGVVY